MVVQAQGDTEGTYISNGGLNKLVDGEYCAIPIFGEPAVGYS